MQRFSDMMDEMCYIVATKHGGSLKGEHGTGRNVAPYVEMEWGSTAYNLMWELKELFDPEYILNPGVILNKARRMSLARHSTPLVLPHGTVHPLLARLPGRHESNAAEQH